MRVELAKVAISPGETIEGTLHAENGEHRIALLWETSGNGTRDWSRGDAVLVTVTDGSAPFSLVAPDAPYSFVGRFIQIAHFVEVDGDVRQAIVIGPGGEACILDESGALDTR